MMSLSPGTDEETVLCSCSDAADALARLEDNVRRLEALTEQESCPDASWPQQLRENHARLLRRYCEHPDGWRIVQIARHPARPTLQDHIRAFVRDFRELHGDRRYGDDRAIVTGLGRIEAQKLLIVGHDKGRTVADKARNNSGRAYPEGYRKALAKMKLAEKFGLPVLCMVDTPGAHPGPEAEARGQASAIASNLREMSRLRIPVLVINIGEGGSAGALGIGVGDRVAMMQYSYYSAISPEACAAILYGNTEELPAVAAAPQVTGKDALRLGFVDSIIPEPIGGAHRNPGQASRNLKEYILKTMDVLCQQDISSLLERRYARLRAFGTAMCQRSQQVRI